MCLYFKSVGFVSLAKWREEVLLLFINAWGREGVNKWEGEELFKLKDITGTNLCKQSMNTVWLEIRRWFLALVSEQWGLEIFQWQYWGKKPNYFLKWAW